MDKQNVIYFGIVTLGVELAWRINSCTSTVLNSSFDQSEIFLIFFIICIVVSTLHLDKYSFFKNQNFKKLITFLHAIDEFTILLIGYSIYKERNDILFVSLLLSTKLCCLTLIKRTVTGVDSKTMFDSMLQTAKIFLHHHGSFLFLNKSIKSTLILTVIWRFVSMSSHSLIAFKSQSFEKSEMYIYLHWILAYSRKCILLIVLLCCFVNNEIQRGFGISALGHISYLVVRIGPVFNLGSIYIHHHNDKILWKELSFKAKLKTLLSLKYPWFLVELSLHIFCVLYFIYLRIITTSVIVQNHCYFY
jgi:hypothetical protein